MIILGMSNFKLIFIISHKYYRGYESYIEYYINNINKFYDGALIIVVDNNSIYKDDIFNKLINIENVILLDNNIESKFELGAYTVGLKYIIDNDILDRYNYLIFTQDNFILKNKYDFYELEKNNITACPINSYYQDGYLNHISHQVLDGLKLNNNLDKITFCWCNSFIIHNDKIQKLYEYINQIKIINRTESEASERYFSRILYELNDHVNYDIDGDIRNLNTKYDCWKVNPYDEIIGAFFVKKVQQKNENTLNK